MIIKQKISFLFAAFIFLILSFSCWQNTSENKLTSEAKQFVGKPLNIQDFEKNTFQNNIEVDTNKRIWLIYLLSTCEACKKELETIRELKSERNSQIEIVGVMSEDEEVIKKFAAEHNIEFPILLDKQAYFIKNLNLKYFPANFVIENGIIKKALFGLPKNEELINFVKN
ncbi:MAG TPA: TlpA disulfide reductase family protein [Pyrinomonadaceae bacterium]|nr:TlpA disulfide reductase family protein [Pyrinomonadaceae bacterium]